jgi:transcriptional regulator with XRE-family HTH domain
MVTDVRDRVRFDSAGVKLNLTQNRDTPMATFGATLRELRERAGLSQRALAEKAGVGQKSISFWEMDQGDPSFTNIQKLCSALGVTCDAFFKADERSTGKRPKKK